jgi:hypothetical protein
MAASVVLAAGCGGGMRHASPPPPSKGRVANAFEKLVQGLVSEKRALVQQESGSDTGPIGPQCQRQANFDLCSLVPEGQSASIGGVKLTVLGHDCYRVEVQPPEFVPNLLQLTASSDVKTGEEILRAAGKTAPRETLTASSACRKRSTVEFSPALPDRLVAEFDVLANQALEADGKIFNCDDTADGEVHLCLYGTRKVIQGGFRLARVGADCYRLSHTDRNGVPMVTRRYSTVDFDEGTAFYDISSSTWHADNGSEVVGC